jgi:signal transduction histidine kinase
MALRRNPAADSADETMFVFAAAMAIVFALGAVGLDFVTPVELDIAPLYALALLMAGLARSSRLVWALVAVLVAVTFVVLAVNGGPGAFGLDSIGFANRVLDAAALLVTAGLLHIWLASLEVRDRQARELEAQNRKVAAANAALAEHDAELARQNAVLDELRRLAEAASGRKTRMLTSVSHDIRSPVNAINLIVELIRRTAGDPEREAQLPRMVQRLQDNAASLLGLVTDVLDIAQFDAGHAQTRITAFSLAA